MQSNSQADLIEHEQAVYSDTTKPYLSNSQLECISSCSLLYKFRYIDKIKISMPSIPLYLGDSFHKAVEAHYREAWERKAAFVPVLDKLVITFDLYWATYLKELKNSEAINQDKADKARDIGIGLLKKFIEKEKRNPTVPISFIPEDSNTPIPAIELNLRVPIINLKTKKLISDKYDLLAYIDLVGINKFGLTIQDHKTSSKKYGDLKIETSLQLLIYDYIYRYYAREGRFIDAKGKALNPNEATTVYNVYIKTKDPAYQCTKNKITENDLDRLYYVVEKAQEIIDKKIFLPTSGQKCEMCEMNYPLASICKSWQRNMKLDRNSGEFKKIFSILKKKYGAEIA